MTHLRSLGGKRWNYKELGTTGEWISIDSDRHQVQRPLDDTYDGVFEEEVLAEEVHLSVNSTSIHNVVLEEDRDLAEEIQSVNMSTEEDQAKLQQDAVSRDVLVQKQIQDQALVTQLVSQIDTVSLDIIDFIEENPTQHVVLSVEDMDKMISRIEELRSKYRGSHRELQRYIGNTYNENFLQGYNMKLHDIKCFIKEVKAKRNNSRLDQDIAKNNSAMLQAKKLQFLVSETDRRIGSLESIFSEDLNAILDEDIVTRKGAFPEHQKEMQYIAKNIQEIIGTGATDLEVDRVQQRYVDLNSEKSQYLFELEQEIKKREIEKQKNFNKSVLNINLGKFKGYNSKIDIYSFQDQFEKLYLKSTPNSMLPDVLINRHLEGPAQLLVKSNDDIDDIWRRLKDVYGDIKTLLLNKLAELDDIGQISKQREPAKVVDALSKLVHLMKDLVQLAKRHKIENKLYYGGGIDKVYHLMGESLLSRWLVIAQVEEEGEDQWVEIIEFLEKELKINQQKVNIYSTSSQGSGGSRGTPRTPGTTRTPESYYTDGQRDAQGGQQGAGDQPGGSDTTCSFCGESGHITTSGPGGARLIQYFACKKFVDMPPALRFQALRTKGFCIQCLYPGADCNLTKHAEGRCQRDFVCKHTSHERHTVKKHVLLCEDHKGTTENKDLLQKYKTRCILRRNSDRHPSFSREIQLSHYVTSPIKVAPPTTDLEKHVAFDDDDVLPLEVVPSDTVNFTDQQTGVSGNGGDQAFPADDSVDVGGDQAFPADDSVDVDDDELLDDDDEFKRDDSRNGVYILQTIKVDHHLYSMFYDNGCSKFCVKHSATQLLGSNRARQRKKAIHSVGGISGTKAEARHGIWTVKLPLADGGDAFLTGTCFDQITETFPMYPLAGVIESEIRTAYHEAGNNVNDLPNLPQFVGGDTAFMLGSGFMRYFPIEQFRLPSGLSIFKSMFANPDGSLGVIGGPHWLITQIEQQHYHGAMSFLASQREIYNNGFQINPDIKLLSYKNEYDDIPDVSIREKDACYAQRTLKRFEEGENAGSEINYRCPNCRGCKTCKNGELTEEVSIKNEAGQHMIEECVTVDVDKGVTTANLPLLGDPAIMLAPNRNQALKVYNQQLKRLWKNPKDV